MDKNFSFDFYRMTGHKYKLGFKNKVKILFSHRLKYLYLWRKTKKRNTFLRRLRLYLYGRRYGLEISTTASIGNGLYLGHAFNITVGKNVVMGKNVNLHKGCTIGSENRGKRKGAPRIGNRVSIGINATIVGGVNIGDDVMIAPNTFVNFDVPSHSIVIGNPGVIHHRENATESYIGFLVGED